MLPLNNRPYYCTQTILLHVSGRVRVWDKQDSYNSFENSRQVYSLDMLPIGSEHQHVYASNSDSANTRSLFRPLLSVSTVIVAQRYSRFWSYVRKARFYRSVRIILAPFSLHLWLGIRSWRSLVARTHHLATFQAMEALSEALETQAVRVVHRALFDDTKLGCQVNRGVDWELHAARIARMIFKADISTSFSSRWMNGRDKARYFCISTFINNSPN